MDERTCAESGILIHLLGPDRRQCKIRRHPRRHSDAMVEIIQIHLSDKELFRVDCQLGQQVWRRQLHLGRRLESCIGRSAIQHHPLATGRLGGGNRPLTTLGSVV